MLKCHVIVLDRNDAYPYFKARYDHDTQIVEVLKRGHKVIDRFEVNPEHIYNERGKLGLKGKKPLIFIDNATRHSVNADSVKDRLEDSEHKNEEKKKMAKSTKLHSDKPLDVEKRNKLNYLIEPAFWKGLFGKYKMPFTTFLIVFVSGMGTWHIIRLVLIALGLVEGVI